MATPQIDYTKYLYKDPNIGVYSLVGGTARPISDASSIDPSILANLQTKTFGTDTNGYDPVHGGGTTGGAQTFASLQPNIYAMDSTYKDQVDQANVAANPNINQMPATKSPAYGSAAYIQQNPTEALNSASTGSSLPPATEAPSTTPKAGYIKAYDTNNGGAAVYVKPGLYYKGISLSPVPSPTAPVTPASLGTEKKVDLAGTTPSGETGGTKSGVNGTISQEASAEATRVAADVANRKAIIEANKTDVQKAYDSSLLDMVSGAKGIEGQAAYKAKLQQEQLDPINKSIDDLSIELASVKSQKDALIAEQRGKPVTMNTIIGATAQINAVMDAKILGIAGMIDALNGNYARAEKNIQMAVDAKYGPAEEKFNIAKAQRDSIREQATADQKLVLDALDAADARKKQESDDAKAASVQIGNLMLKASEAGVTDQNILSRIVNSKTLQEAQQIYALNTPNANVTDLQSKYPDAGINSTDTFAVAQSKLKNSRIYQQQTRLSGGTGEGGGGTNGVYVPGANQVVDSWAERIQSGQAKITDIPSKEAGLRNQVTVALQAMGNTTEGKPTVTEMGKAALATAQDLLTKVEAGTGTGAIGKSSLFNKLTIPGTDKANFINEFNSLKSQLSLEGVKFLKGQGQVSDAERALLGQAVTKLNLSQSESEFKSTLNGIISKLSGTSETVNSSSPPSGTDGTAYGFPGYVSDGKQWVLKK